MEETIAADQHPYRRHAPAAALEHSESHLLGSITARRGAHRGDHVASAHSSELHHSALHHAIALPLSDPRKPRDLYRRRISPTSPDTHRVPDGRALHHTLQALHSHSVPGGRRRRAPYTARSRLPCCSFNWELRVASRQSEEGQEATTSACVRVCVCGGGLGAGVFLSALAQTGVGGGRRR